MSKLRELQNSGRLLCLLLSLSLSLCGCQSRLQTYNHDMYCLSSPPAAQTSEDIRLALVLSGGGARGMAHVGVLEVFEEEGIPIDMIVGCSAGSLVGALYSCHPSASWIKSELSEMRRGDFITFDFFTKCHGLSRGTGLKNFLLKHLGAIHFEELSIPLIVVATDLCTGELVSFGLGPVAPAVHASCAFPFVFSPVRIGGKIFVDGGVIDPVPVREAKKYSPGVVVAVDLTTLLPESLPTNLFGVAIRCHEIRTLSQSTFCASEADVIIQPDLDDVGLFDDASHEASYEAGKAAAREAVPKIFRLLRAIHD